MLPGLTFTITLPSRRRPPGRCRTFRSTYPWNLPPYLALLPRAGVGPSRPRRGAGEVDIGFTEALLSPVSAEGRGRLSVTSRIELLFACTAYESGRLTTESPRHRVEIRENSRIPCLSNPQVMPLERGPQKESFPLSGWSSDSVVNSIFFVFCAWPKPRLPLVRLPGSCLVSPGGASLVFRQQYDQPRPPSLRPHETLALPEDCEFARDVTN